MATINYNGMEKCLEELAKCGAVISGTVWLAPGGGSPGVSLYIYLVTLRLS